MHPLPLFTGVLNDSIFSFREGGFLFWQAILERCPIRLAEIFRKTSTVAGVTFFDCQVYPQMTLLFLPLKSDVRISSVEVTLPPYHHLLGRDGKGEVYPFFIVVTHMIFVSSCRMEPDEVNPLKLILTPLPLFSRSFLYS